MVSQQIGETGAGLWKHGRGWILFMICSGWFLSMGVRLIYPVILPQIFTEFTISYGTAGISLSVLWVAYAAVNAPGGLIADYLGERLLLTSSMILSAAGLIAVVASQTFPQFIVATTLLGIGTGLFGTTGTTVLTDIYSQHDTTAISVSQIAASIGSVLIPVTAGFLAVHTGWRVGLVHAAPFFLVAGVGMWLTLPMRTSPVATQNNSGPRAILRDIKDTFSSRTLLLVVGGLTAVGFVYQGLTGFLPMYLIEMKGFSQQQATLSFGLLFFSMIVGKILSGPIANRVGNRLTLIGYGVVSLPGFVLIPLIDEVGILIIGVWIAGLILGYTPVATTYAMELIPADVQGGVFGIIRTVFLGVGAFAPPVIGLFADIGQFDIAFVSFLVFALLAAVLSFLLPTDN